MEFNQCVTNYCSSWNTLQNFGLHSIVEPSLGFSLMFARTQTHPMSPCWVLAPSSLDYSSDIFLHVGHSLMLADMFWPCTKSAFMCTSCVWFVKIHHSHTQSYMNCRASVFMVVQWSITSVTLVAHTDGQSHGVYVVFMVWGFLLSKSCWVCVSKVMHVRSHSFTHLVILLKLCRRDQP